MKLQNNFTTPEQSKRLLELGVPADSADCYYVTSVGKKPNIIHNNLDFDLKSKATQKPCWSVGRLIEIIKICSDLNAILGYQIAYNTKHKTSLLHIVIQVIEDYINEFNFSKLEE
jgi:hypothetical protein